MNIYKFRPFILSLLLVCLSVTVQVRAQQGFAVQVASVQSRAEAVALVNGLRARGLNSYWVQAEVEGLVYYRIRVGSQFASNKGAADFGRKLVRDGMVNEYAVLKYEPSTEAGYSGAALEKSVARTHPHKAGSTQPAWMGNSLAKPGKAGESAPLKKGANGKTPAPSGRKVADYLVTGEPQGEAAIPNSSSPAKPSNDNVPVAKAKPVQEFSSMVEVKRRVDKTQLGAEVELDDFKEFAPQVLKASIEAKENGLFVTLQNQNTRHRFRGTVNLKVRQNEHELQQPAMQLELAPGAENSFELPGIGRDVSYLLTVYDEQRTLQLMQQGVLGHPARQADFANTRTALPASNSLGEAGNVPPQSADALGQTQAEEEPPPPSLKTSNYPTGKVEDENVPTNEAQTETPDGAGQTGDVKIIVRQVAASSENLTIEFEILAPQPLGMLVMAVHTASMNDSKQAIMTTKQGRLPFLVPASDANGAISYELKDETGRLIATGSKAFQEIPKQ